MLVELAAATLLSLYRMFTAYIISLFIALFTGIAMARNKYVEAILLPVLDILQSIPILGFFPLFLVIFIGLLGPSIGGEVSAILLIVTSLVWNMIFGVYASIKSLDPSFLTMSKIYKLPLPLRLSLIYIPAARPSILSNSIISWAGGWFFLTSAEVISMGSQTYKLIGLGSFILDASDRGDLASLTAGVIVLILVIIVSYLLVWNPSVIKYTEVNILPAVSTFYNLIERIIAIIWRYIVWGSLKIWLAARKPSFILLPVMILLYSPAIKISPLAIYGFSQILGRGLIYLNYFISNVWITLLRVYLVLGVSALVTIPLAYSSSRSRKTGYIACIAGELLSSIPAIVWWPLLLPLAFRTPWLVMFFVYIQGSLWYIYFNVMIFGLQYVKKDLFELADIYGVRGFIFFKSIFLPAILPSLATGLLSASGGAWNASIAAEYIFIGNRIIDLGGVGSVIDKLANQGDATGVLWTAIYMSLIIVAINKIVWSRLFKRVGSRYVVE
ncbi:ABC transporter permease subunit [Thermogladius sp. 4427co]|uniref:ABC transporter permease subunit n=1 Tax=Thermogladius sp. 4427co TaxID=3450718 RepID=UPI003F7921DE